MLDTESDLRLHVARQRLQFRYVGLGSAQHHHGADEQLHQPFHLRRQVPRFSEGHQTHVAQTGRAFGSACGDAESRHRTLNKHRSNQIRSHGRSDVGLGHSPLWTLT